MLQIMPECSIDDVLCTIKACAASFKFSEWEWNFYELIDCKTQEFTRAGFILLLDLWTA